MYSSLNVKTAYQIWMAFIRPLWQEFPDFVQKNMNHFYQYWFFEIVKTVNIVLNLEGIYA